MGDDLALLAEAAREAGRLMLQMRAGCRVSGKPDGSPVTDADLAVDALLIARLRGARPGYGWLSEESADDAARLGCTRVFVVDPIDGTTAYVRGKPWFSTALAVVEAGRPVAAAIFAPATGELFTARAGGGARRDGEPIHASKREALAGARIAGDPAIFPRTAWPQLELVRRNAISYRLALTAAGEVDATVSPTDKWEWDVAAGALIAAEAGACVTDARGEALRFNSPEAKLPGLACCAPGLHGEIVRRTLISRPPPPMPADAFRG